MRYGDADKRFFTDYAADSPFLHYISSTLLFWEREEDSCRNVGMAALERGQKTNGSLALLWPYFLSMCLSQFVETLACTMQGRHPLSETSLFEHSLAYAEAEARSTVLKPVEMAMMSEGNAKDNSGTVDGLPQSQKAVLGPLNVTHEVLLLSLISAVSNLTSNVLAVFGLRRKLRLINTTVLGVTYMLVILGSFIRALHETSGNWTDTGWVFRFPTTFLIGYVPHLLLIAGMVSCAMIYGTAFILTMLSPPPGIPYPSTFRQRVTTAYRNLQANVYLSTGNPVNFSWEDDFFTSVLKAGFAFVTAASEAVYFNEGTKVKLEDRTWLEAKRLEELVERRGLLYKRMRESIPPELRSTSISSAVSLADERRYDPCMPQSHSGYAIERKARTDSKSEELAVATDPDSGIGFLERHGRWAMAMRFMQSTFWLLAGLQAHIILFILQKLGVAYRPHWLRRLLGDKAKKNRSRDRTERKPKDHALDFWMLSEDGSLKRPENSQVDIEVEMRRRFAKPIWAESSTRVPSVSLEEELDGQLYRWWKHGGWWGDVDGSGDYEISSSQLEDDQTSLISYSTDVSGPDQWSDIDDDGRRTPTQDEPFPSEPTPDDVFDTERLAELLDPQNPELRQEARMLSRRLRKPAVMTRSQYNREVFREQASVLTSSRFGPQISDRDGPLSDEDEEKLLEQLILSRRKPSNSASHSNNSWDRGANGMGPGGPQCVLCQDSPRTILLWPCGHLALCDDCRVNMATRNFSRCVCCRTPTVAYSRLYVP